LHYLFSSWCIKAEIELLIPVNSEVQHAFSIKIGGQSAPNSGSFFFFALVISMSTATKLTFTPALPQSVLLLLLSHLPYVQGQTGHLFKIEQH